MLFAGSLLVVLAGLIGASMIIGHHNQTVPVVVADNRPVRVKPDNPGGMQINGAESDVFSGAMDNAHAKLAPAAEAPDPNGMRGPIAAPAPIASDAPQPSPLAASPPAKTPAAPAYAPAPTAVPPAKPTVATQSPAATPTPHQQATARAASVQLAALTSEQAAHDEWQQLVRRMPELLGGHQPSFSRIERDSHTFWRLRTTGFADIAQARAFCEHVRAKGSGCSVAEF